MIIPILGALLFLQGDRVANFFSQEAFMDHNNTSCIPDEKVDYYYFCIIYYFMLLYDTGVKGAL